MDDRLRESAGRLAGRRVMIGLSGGIACYKVASVVSALAQSGVEVTVAMTEAATKFVTPLTFEALSGRPVHVNPWVQVDAADPQHIRLARSAHAMVVAPCTMDLLAKLATGRCDDMVSLLASAMDLTRQVVLLAPSMNEVMWNQRSTQRNLSQARSDGFGIIAPGEGWQACRTVGVGRLPEPHEIVEVLAEALEGRPA
jgi:phosphopantothenoylcysteine decarboxylase / phosphopantothenate---cysteine ligase